MGFADLAKCAYLKGSTVDVIGISEAGEQKQQQIPFGNDNKKGKSKGSGVADH